MAPKLVVLLDQNVPFPVLAWLQEQKPDWQIWHTRQVNLQGATDSAILQWAVEHHAIVITYDDDFTNLRFLSAQQHVGIVRLMESSSLSFQGLSPGFSHSPL